MVVVVGGYSNYRHTVCNTIHHLPINTCGIPQLLTTHEIIRKWNANKTPRQDNIKLFPCTCTGHLLLFLLHFLLHPLLPVGWHCEEELPFHSLDGWPTKTTGTKALIQTFLQKPISSPSWITCWPPPTHQTMSQSPPAQEWHAPREWVWDKRRFRNFSSCTANHSQIS